MANQDTAMETQEYRQRLSIALKAAGICVFEVDLQRQLYTFFENAEDIFGVSGENILVDVQPYSALSAAEYQKAVSDYFSHPEDFKEIDRAFRQVLAGKSTTYHARMKAGGSGFVWCKIDVTPVLENGVPVKMIGVITDISDFKTKTEVLEQRVLRDEFTGLYSKKSCISLIENALRHQGHQRHALVMADIDNFKPYNDAFGHAAGDVVILRVVRVLKACLRKNDIVGRFGGDEFLIFMQDIPSTAWIGEKLERLRRSAASFSGCTVSLGASIFPDDAVEFAPLFEKTDQALYQAKQYKNIYKIYSQPEESK